MVMDWVMGEQDTGQPRKKDYLEFLKTQAARFERVFVVTGNHEYYSSDRTFDNLHFLQMSSVLPEDNGHKVRVLGTTLWHHCPEKEFSQVESTMNDYAMIGVPSTTSAGAPLKRKLKATDTNSWAEEVAWLKAAIKKAKKAGEAVVVLTHHLPSNNMVWGGRGFSTDLEKMIKSPIIFWGYGHTHASYQKVINGVMVASNQLGYISMAEETGFYPEFVVTIDHDGKRYTMRNDPDRNKRDELAKLAEEEAKKPAEAAPPPPPPPAASQRPANTQELVFSLKHRMVSDY
ncbi:metallophosphoesterase [Acanthamoeba castellanii str. Neff]|uniref:Metallophosphoesterase n=1 Tax=Acanthamoeba castellanii (strain ATCC 30010 / Neff) TaxID=1257118 RepID=L8GZL2_ACACF|nr:metallophosphoesterase [Acanthamoeba castellanii str. Neff]ELR18440.1 metallophosphoesterase [Acanthamoeba castellanii str. Neff]